MNPYIRITVRNKNLQTNNPNNWAPFGDDDNDTHTQHTHTCTDRNTHTTHTDRNTHTTHTD